MPLMKDGGSIILNSSAGVKGFPALPFTVQAKQPSVLSPRTWTSGLKGKIGVNVIAPGTTDTAIFDGAPQEMKDSFVTIIPIGPMGQSRKIAADALFLASDDFSFVTGIELYVDSGTAQV